ncbi:flagellin [Gammaproteobacteria bacterium]
MAQIVNTNLYSINTRKHLERSSMNLQVSMERLSSGLRINSARDDAAGLAITERQTAQVRGMTQAIRNANDGISYAQTAESNLVEVTNALQRIRELAVQSANGIYSTTDRDAMNKEVTQLRREVSRILKTANFNRLALFASASGNVNTLTVNAAGTKASGALSPYPRISGIVFQIGADDGYSFRVSTGPTELLHASAMLNIFGASGVSNTFTWNINVSGAGISVSTQVASWSAIRKIDAALTLINNTRATFGALQNRLESTIANLRNVIDATENARSRIRDTDFAAETSSLTRAQVLQQAGMAMLGQANAQPQQVLSLLRG